MLVGTSLLLLVPTAVAGPEPVPAGVAEAPCRVGMDGLAGLLRGAGYTAQAANTATHIRFRDCRAERAAH